MPLLFRKSRLDIHVKISKVLTKNHKIWLLTQKNKCDEKQEMYLLNFKEGKKIREEAQIRWRKFISKSNQYKLQYYVWNETEQTP